MTSDPYGFWPWLGGQLDSCSIAKAVHDRDIQVVWVYHDSEMYARQRPLHLHPEGDDPDEQQSHYQLGTRLLHMARDLEPSEWTLLESSVPHFYFAFLSVPKAASSQNQERKRERYHRAPLAL